MRRESERPESSWARHARLLVALAVGALLVPAAAGAKPGKDDKPKPHCGRQFASYVFRGTYEGHATVRVRKGNRPVRRSGFVGDEIRFNFKRALYSVADVDGDGDTDMLDVQVGDEVVVRARLPKGSPGRQPFAARSLADNTHPEGEDDPLPEDEQSGPPEGDDEPEPGEPEEPEMPTSEEDLSG